MIDKAILYVDDEKDVLDTLLRELGEFTSEYEIAGKLKISESTVRSHQTNCYLKAITAFGVSISSKAQFKKSFL